MAVIVLIVQKIPLGCNKGMSTRWGRMVWVSVPALLSLCVALGNSLTTPHPRLLTRNTRLPQMGL